MNFHRTLILASSSPRRQELLKAAGFNFEVKVIDTDESFPASMPVLDVAQYVAQKKANAFAEKVNDEIIITADTMVISGNQALGKPKNVAEAKLMLQRLSGKSHQVITGVCVFSKEKQVSFDETTEVLFKKLTDKEIDYYIKHFQPFDKAGAYGIQEWIGMIGIEKIIGSYYNVMGLPTHKVYEVLMGF